MSIWIGLCPQREDATKLQLKVKTIFIRTIAARRMTLKIKFWISMWWHTHDHWCEKHPSLGIFLVCIFPYSNCRHRFTEYRVLSSNICNETLLQKQLAIKSRGLFLQKRSIIDV